VHGKSTTFYGITCLVLFALMGLTVLLIDLFVVSVRTRRAVARRACRWFFAVVGIRFRVEGLERLPKGPCVVVANHASYLDGPIMAAALPPEFCFVIKKEMVRVPIMSVMLRRLGSEFVERFDRHKSAVDARRVLKRAAAGQSLVFFPEGTFTSIPAIGHFHAGAFATAARTGVPVVAVAIRGARYALPAGTLMMRRVAIEVEILAVIPTTEQEGVKSAKMRQKAREIIALAVGEELAS
jgi:1-acyl-sn-glycerol-3-phosphate acyltransferase